VVVVIIAVALAAASAYVTLYNPDIRPAWARRAAFAVILLALWVPVELAVAVYLRRNKVLSKVGAGK